LHNRYEKAYLKKLYIININLIVLGGLILRQNSLIYLILVAILLVMPALGQGQTNAIDALIHSLSDNNTSVRDAAASALEKIGNPAVEPLILALNNSNSSIQVGAEFALKKIRDPGAVEPLIWVLKNDKDPYVKANAALALGMINDSKAAVPLAQALKDEDVNVRRGSAVALVELATRDIKVGQAEDSLLLALNDTDGTVRANAATALGNIKDKRAVNPLMRSLADRDWSVRRYAAYALGSIGDPRASGPLTQALKDENSSVRETAATALGEIKVSSSHVQDAKASKGATNSKLVRDICSCTNDIVMNKSSPSGLRGFF
jgi:HEAT repeat protein